MRMVQTARVARVSLACGCTANCCGLVCGTGCLPCPPALASVAKQMLCIGKFPQFPKPAGKPLLHSIHWL